MTKWCFNSYFVKVEIWFNANVETLWMSLKDKLTIIKRMKKEKLSLSKIFLYLNNFRQAAVHMSKFRIRCNNC